MNDLRKTSLSMDAVFSDSREITIMIAYILFVYILGVFHLADCQLKSVVFLLTNFFYFF